MYFYELYDIDDRWPEDNDEACLDRFHDIMTKKFIKQKIEDIGRENFQILIDQFNSIKNCGINFMELNDQLDLSLIKRISKEEYDRMIDENIL